MCGGGGGACVCINVTHKIQMFYLNQIDKKKMNCPLILQYKKMKILCLAKFKGIRLELTVLKTNNSLCLLFILQRLYCKSNEEKIFVY